MYFSCKYFLKEKKINAKNYLLIKFEIVFTKYVIRFFKNGLFLFQRT
jgi:hypothetical protein